MREESYAQPFLSTHRALSTSAREFARLSSLLVERAAEAFGDESEKRQSIRRSPDRCIIQIGSSAVTVAWIGGRHDTAEGELLIIHWRGTVAPTIHQQFERTRELTLTASPLNESVFVAEATCETDWMWRSREEPLRRYSSPSLAADVIERLRSVVGAID
jgi:hypothetical protein